MTDVIERNIVGAQKTRGYFENITSVIVTVATTIDIVGREDFPHNFLGIQFFSDANGTPATAGAGTGTVTVETINNEGVFEAPPSNVITAATPTTVSWDGNTKAIKIVPAGITTATHWRAVYTSNRS